MWVIGKIEKEGNTIMEHNLWRDSQGLCSTYDSDCPEANIFPRITAYFYSHKIALASISKCLYIICIYSP